MTYQSPRIYTYKITFEEVPYYYYGSKKERYYNQEYWGSPTTHKWCWELYTPKKQILEIFDYTDEGYEEALEVERRLIKPVYNTDKWCLNESCGGKISLEASRKSGKKTYETKSGMFSMSKEERHKMLKKNCEMKIGIYSLTPEQRRENAIKGYKKAKELGVGIYALTSQQKSEAGKKSNEQKWMCLETGYITTSGPLSRYQKSRGIDTSKRKRIA
jgi:hypothetical protein